MSYPPSLYTSCFYIHKLFKALSYQKDGTAEFFSNWILRHYFSLVWYCLNMNNGWFHPISNDYSSVLLKFLNIFYSHGKHAKHSSKYVGQYTYFYMFFYSKKLFTSISPQNSKVSVSTSFLFFAFQCNLNNEHILQVLAVFTELAIATAVTCYLLISHFYEQFFLQCVR